MKRSMNGHWIYGDTDWGVLVISRHEDGVRIQVEGTERVVSPEDVEEVCAALRDAAGLPPVWTVEKVPLDDDYDVLVREDGAVRDSGAYRLTPTAARLHAAQLLAAADEAEARANRPKLPTAHGSVVRARGVAYTRMSEDGVWMKAGSDGMYYDPWVAGEGFTVLYDPEKAS